MLPLEFCNRQLCKFHRAQKILGVSFVVDGQLFASINAILRIADDFLPEFRRARMFAAPLRHQREIAPRLRTEFGGKSGVERLRARGLRALRFAALLQKSREAEEIETFDFVSGIG